MKGINKMKTNQRRILSAMLTGLFLLQQTMVTSALGTEITGYTGKNGVYNIDPAGWITGTGIGYTKYKDFELSKGDIANLIFKYGKDGKIHDIDTFINLVRNQVKIDGIINSMKDGKFYNGRAIFVSPKGVVVGASGVINVGSLGIYTPTEKAFKDYESNPRADLSALKNTNNGKEITINGKVFAAKDIELIGGKVTVSKDAGVFNGINEGKMGPINYESQAQDLFNQLIQIICMLVINFKVTAEIFT